jgi:HK97 family phage major capsid protein
MSKLKELREQRARDHAELTQILLGADSPESRETAKKIITAMNEAKTQIDAIESRGLSAVGQNTPLDKDIEFRRAFMSYLRNGENRMKPEDRDILSSRTRREQRDVSEGSVLNQLGSFSSLGYFVPAGFVYDVETATKYYAPLLDGGNFTVMDTATGQVLPYPTSNDTTQTASIVTEAGITNEQDVSASHINFGAYKFTSGLVKASIELIQDSAFPLESWLASNFGRRFGRAFEYMFTQGEGVTSGEPTGLLTAIAKNATLAPIIANGSSESSGNGAQTGANSIGWSDLVNLEHSVDPSYRRGAKYMLHDNTVASIQKIIDKFGRPLWTPGIAEHAPDRINGYEFVVNQSMPQIAASNVTVAFGDLSKMLVRRVRDFSVLVLRERYAEFGQVGFLGFMRVDSNLLDAGTGPVNVLMQHS